MNWAAIGIGAALILTGGTYIALVIIPTTYDLARNTLRALRTARPARRNTAELATPHKDHHQ